MPFFPTRAELNEAARWIRRHPLRTAATAAVATVVCVLYFLDDVATPSAAPTPATEEGAAQSEALSSEPTDILRREDEAAFSASATGTADTSTDAQPSAMASSSSSRTAHTPQRHAYSSDGRTGKTERGSDPVLQHADGSTAVHPNSPPTNAAWGWYVGDGDDEDTESDTVEGTVRGMQTPQETAMAGQPRIDTDDDSTTRTPWRQRHGTGLVYAPSAQGNPHRQLAHLRLQSALQTYVEHAGDIPIPMP